MQPIRFYLLLRITDNWTASVHRDFGSLLNEWEIYKGRLDVTSVIHVGLNRASFESYEKIANLYSGRVLLTASARWVLDHFCKCAPYQAGLVENIPVYLATDGWGYTINPEDYNLNQPEISFPATTVVLPHSNISSAWLTELNHQNPAIFNIINAIGISDETTYFQLEISLSSSLRYKVGVFRFLSLTKNETLNDLDTILKYAPPWLYDVEIIQLNFSVRVSNVFLSIGILKIIDLFNYTAARLLKLPRFGANSLENVTSTLLKYIYSKQEIQAVTDTSLLNNASQNLNLFSEETLITNLGYQSPSNSHTFDEAIQQIFLSIDPKVSSILKCRMGFECEQMTLHETGTLFGFTRERARQIESKGVKFISKNPVWNEILFPKLKNIFENRIDSITVAGLSLIDSWFTGISNYLEPFKFILDRIPNEGFYLISANGQVFISRINQEQWNQVCRVAINLLENGADQKWTINEAKKQIGDLLPVKADDLRSELWIVASKFAHFSIIGGDKILVGVGRNAEVLVESVLAESFTPLHFTEIAKRIKEKYEKNIDLRRVHNAAQIKGYIYGRGTYGHLKHCSLNADELNVIRSRCEELILNSTESRQWSCSELADILENEGLDFDNRLNRYIVNIALTQSHFLSNLKRMIWTRATDAPSSSAHRVDLSQAVESLLINTGRPMTTNEVKEAIQRERGLGDTFQIHASRSVIRVGQGVWGLIDRDLRINQSERNLLVQEIESLLKRLNHGIHFTEISKLISSISNIANQVDDPTVFFTLAQRTGRMRISQGNYLFLSEWGGARRLSPNQAITTVILKAKIEGLRASEISSQASKLLGREIKKETVYYQLYALGAHFDENTGRWFPPSEDESEDEGFN